MSDVGSSGWVVVRDEGFRPADVQQGGVGDCWFMSALAVVAERHDLMSKLLPNLNSGAESGCHEVRLFLDGRWTSLLVDDQLPTTAKQRRPTADGSGLAFGRCARRQLWVSLIEKAYAKAHGAYRFISGGETSEALLELTGAPTEVVQFRDPGFDPDLFWARLVSLLQAGCPIGCGTGAETLEELGLVGQHAYSVLETDSAPCLARGFAMEERRVKVRNPWGEWTRREQDELLAQLGAAVMPDEGSFWMNYGDFIRGFAVADICYARDGWHARSFDAEFSGVGVGCRSGLQLRASCGAECWVMAIQPTERGKQVKRPAGYYLNDVSLLIFEAPEASDEEPKLVKAVIGGARRDVVCSVVLEADRTRLLRNNYHVCESLK